MALQVFAYSPEAVLSSYTVYVELSPSERISNYFSGHWMRSTELLARWHRCQAGMHSVNNFFLSLFFVDIHR